jgi:hypothetical protein
MMLISPELGKMLLLALKTKKSDRDPWISPALNQINLLTNMPQTSVLSQPPSLSKVCTCADCPLFRDLEDTRGRGWCDTFDRVTRRHHKATDSCYLALKALLEEQPVPLKVQLDSKELDQEEEHPLPLHSFVADVRVSKPTEPYVKEAIEELGLSESYDISSYWIPFADREF